METVVYGLGLYVQAQLREDINGFFFQREEALCQPCVTSRDFSRPPPRWWPQRPPFSVDGKTQKFWVRGGHHHLHFRRSGKSADTIRWLGDVKDRHPFGRDS